MKKSAQPEAKACAVCGRAIEWRKKWQRNWADVRYCSDQCRSKRLTDTDRALASAILTLLSQRGAGKTICPSEAARLVEPTQWETLMEPARAAARRLVEQGKIVITQQGSIVDPSTAKGPIRLRRA